MRGVEEARSQVLHVVMLVAAGLVVDVRSRPLMALALALALGTAGEKEVRAWTIHKGDTAPQAAGVIHSDFERGFIKAETVAYDALLACGSVAVAREKGLYRMEGKEYVVKDGDVMLFKFNV